MESPLPAFPIFWVAAQMSLPQGPSLTTPLKVLPLSPVTPHRLLVFIDLVMP